LLILGSSLFFQHDVNLQIDPSKLELGVVIGTGAFSRVYEAIYMGEPVAVKQLVDESLANPEYLRREVGLSSKLRHGFIISLRGLCMDPSAVDARGIHLGVCLVLPLAKHGSIVKALDNPDIRNRFISWNQRLLFLGEAASGVYYLHSLNPPIIHRDLKPSNTLLTVGLQPIIADFGLACRLGEETDLGEGTLNYTAPELLNGENASCASDVYAFGLLMQYIAIRSGGPCSEPWAGMTNVQIQELVGKGFRPVWPEVLKADSSLSRFLTVMIAAPGLQFF
jgi:serine/threonine protein kinase